LQGVGHGGGYTARQNANSKQCHDKNPNYRPVARFVACRLQSIAARKKYACLPVDRNMCSMPELPAGNDKCNASNGFFPQFSSRQLERFAGLGQ
jgi:hypothetical protein